MVGVISVRRLCQTVHAVVQAGEAIGIPDDLIRAMANIAVMSRYHEDQARPGNLLQENIALIALSSMVSMASTGDDLTAKKAAVTGTINQLRSANTALSPAQKDASAEIEAMLVRIQLQQRPTGVPTTGSDAESNAPSV